MFEGKNLVLITAEGWSPYAVSEELTPTLYKMLHEGFVFERYYNPIWGASTTDGEYAACIGLVPKAGVWSFQESSSNYLPLCMGRQFSSLGYTTVAYHDHYFDYYRRDLSHPNMGYTYKGLGSGLNVTETWPESDLEMMKLSIDEYIGETPFLAYYMTVSGHLNYTFFGNAMSTLHRDVVEDLDLSDNAKAYLACNYELELALTELLNRLEEAGIADDTVICIAPDHYPYGLSTEEQNELAGHEVDETFELYESCLVLYSPSMEEPVVVTKPCSSLDIVPTLSNLFGLTYDSRLLVGQDVLSTASPLVLFNSRNWITDLGSYDVASRTFTPADGVTDIPDDYVAAINRKVNGKFTVSAQILETDYYRVLWEEAGLLSE
jgi:phosphoglycerol transferase MdoB-like AlkP superfamily enzyme